MAKKKYQRTSTNTQSSSTNTQGSPLEIDLIELGVLVSLLSITASLVFIASSRKALDVEYARLQGIELPETQPTSSQLVVIGAFISLVSSLFFAAATSTRLKRLIQNSLNGTNTDPLTSYNKINSGAFISLIGSLFLTSGAIGRERESRIIII